MANYIRQALHGPVTLPLTPSSGVLEVDAEGLPLYRPDPQLKRHPIDVATALRLEQDALIQEDRQRAGLPVGSPLLRQILRRCAREREFTETVLDDCFPNRDGTQIDVIGRVLDCCLKTCWQPGISGDVPKKDMGI
jgi:hypothetical protein